MAAGQEAETWWYFFFLLWNVDYGLAGLAWKHMGIRLSDVSSPSFWSLWGDRVDVTSWDHLLHHTEPHSLLSWWSSVWGRFDVQPGSWLAPLGTWLLAVLLRFVPALGSVYSWKVRCWQRHVWLQLCLLHCMSLYFSSILKCAPCLPSNTGICYASIFAEVDRVGLSWCCCLWTGN